MYKFIFNSLKNYSEFILESNVKVRRLILLIIDSIVICFSICFAAILINYSDYYSNLKFNYILILSLLVGLPFYIFSGQYKGLTRYIGSLSAYQLCLRNFILIILINVFYSLFLRTESLPINFLVIVWLLVCLLSATVRFLFRDIIIFKTMLYSNYDNKVVIYGAGSAGLLLLKSLQYNELLEVKGFIDDDPSLWGRNILGIEIFPPAKLNYLIQNYRVQKVLLALPSISNKNYKKILNFLKKFNIKVLKVPSLKSIITGKEKINSLIPIKVEELLFRDSVSTDNISLISDFENSTIFVSGAGGSIGSELCRQLIKLKPSKIILFDISEPCLYSIHQELKDSKKDDLELIPVLGSATDAFLIDRIFSENQINIVFHAAAYKHVPMVEINPIQGIQNNIYSTMNLCNYSYKNSIEKFILISSDKAVRPTNIMGASKRISELIVQSFNDISSNFNGNKQNKCIFSMVRFGNVLNSSGSVIPLFEKQIAKGGPITLTHENITRYFMTITEATNLVLQTVALAEGGEIFLLEMGEAIKIKWVAEKMIQLSGLTIKDKNNPNGDIEILIKGLRPGEKLYEELLIDSESIPTKNPFIFKANEKFFSYDLITDVLEELKIVIQDQNKQNLYKLISTLVPEWSNLNS